MLNVSIDVKSDCIDVSWEWADTGQPEPTGYLIKWGDKEQQLKPDVRTFNIPVDDETALLVTVQTMGEQILEYETLVKLRCVNIDKQKEEALILIMVRFLKKYYGMFLGGSKLLYKIWPPKCFETVGLSF